MLTSLAAGFRTIAVEGMPGAGKTTAITSMRKAGYAVVPELAPGYRPVVDAKRAGGHLVNWIKTDEHAQRLGCGRRPVVVDRNWLTALAYDAVDAKGFMRTVHWAWTHLGVDNLRLPSVWIILDVPVDVSLERRRHRHVPGHPWRDAAVLEQLRAFYADPVGFVGRRHRLLGRLMSDVPCIRIDGRRPPDEVTELLLEAAA